MDWVVTYAVDPPVEVEGNPPSLPDLGLTFEYRDGMLIRVNHQITIPEGAKVIEASQRTLQGFWEWLNYWRRARVRIGGAHAQPLDPERRDRDRLIIVPPLQLDASGWLLRPIQMPAPGKFANAPSRLATWLHLANVARDETSPADALRDYFMILEDMLGRDEPSISDIKQLRDFASHGNPLTNPGLLALVERELGSKADQYDPKNADHLRMIRKYRDLARAMVDAELAKVLA